MLVLESHDQPVLTGPVRKVLQGIYHALEHSLRLHYSPVREHAHDLRASSPRNLEGALCKPRLIVIGMLRSKDILCKARVNFRGIRQRAFEQRRCDGNYFEAVALEDCACAVY